MFTGVLNQRGREILPLIEREAEMGEEPGLTGAVLMGDIEKIPRDLVRWDVSEFKTR
jgi:hypothetical protein